MLGLQKLKKGHDEEMDGEITKKCLKMRFDKPFE